MKSSQGVSELPEVNFRSFKKTILTTLFLLSSRMMLTAHLSVTLHLSEAYHEICLLVTLFNSMILDALRNTVYIFFNKVLF